MEIGTVKLCENFDTMENESHHGRTETKCEIVKKKRQSTDILLDACIIVRQDLIAFILKKKIV